MSDEIFSVNFAALQLPPECPFHGYRVFDLSGIDLGTGASRGGNVLQVPWGVSFPVNGGAGIQVNITASQWQTLTAVGNRLQDDATSGVQVDCVTSTSSVSRNYPNIATCFTTSPKGDSWSRRTSAQRHRGSERRPERCRSKGRRRAGVQSVAGRR